MTEYTASATAHGARTGHVRSDSGYVDLDLAVPKEFGGPGDATNPEELFAAGYSACYQSALQLAGAKREIDTSQSEVTARVSFGPPTFTLSVELEATIPGVDQDTAEKLMESAHRTCPYSRATQGNIEVTLTAKAGV
jgi:Ohr subfamily peroxiredoxin